MSQVLARSLVFATDALTPLADLARGAEAAGFARVWTTEYPGRDAVARALAVALGTTRIGVGTGIAYAFTRPPLAMAGLAVDVHRLSGGRFALGLGAGTRGVRRWYGAEFDPPAARLAAYVDEVHQAWARWPDAVAEAGSPEVFAAALGPVMVRTAAQACDGVLLHPLGLVRAHLGGCVLPALRQGARDRPEPVAVAAWCITSVDTDEERARERARAQIAFYLTTPSYGPVVAGTPWPPVAAAIAGAYEESGRRATFRDLAALVPESLVDEIALAGTPAQVQAQAGRREGELSAAGITELVFQTVGAGLREAEAVANCRHIIDHLGPGPRPSAAGARPGVREGTR